MTGAPAPDRPRSELVREAVLRDLDAYQGAPIPLALMANAREVAANARELYVVVHRLTEAGVLERSGDGYHRGDPFRYARRSS